MFAFIFIQAAAEIWLGKDFEDKGESADSDNDNAENSDDAEAEPIEPIPYSDDETSAGYMEAPPGAGKTDHMDEAGPSKEFSAMMESKDRLDARDSDNDEVDSDPEEDISGANRDYGPFRDESSRNKINSHVVRTRNSDSVMSTRSLQSIDPRTVKARVKSQLKKEHDRQKHRRIRKAGEASLVNRSRREQTDNIKQSLGSDWY